MITKNHKQCNERNHCSEPASPCHSTLLPEIGAVVPFYNGQDCLEKCAQSLTSSGLREDQIFIIDNSPKPAIPNSFNSGFPNVHTIRTTPRLGFGKACNEGAINALKRGFRYLLFINQDARLSPNALSEMFCVLEADPTVAIAAPVNCTEDQEVLESFFLRHYLSDIPELVNDALLSKTKCHYYSPRFCGSCFLIRSSAVQHLGLFDPAYFMYMEEEDLARRYRYCGYRISTVPNARVFHRHSHINSPTSMSSLMIHHKSEQIFLLKDPSRHPLRSASMAARQLLIQLVTHVTKMSIVTALMLVLTNALIVVSIPKILRSRSNELALKNRTLPPL
jgi:N-acetylglucosaminyl-diphospho-decaprenol L-rhamnosyltransferase